LVNHSLQSVVQDSLLFNQQHSIGVVRDSGARQSRATK
jgi:hypothetical protein